MKKLLTIIGLLAGLCASAHAGKYYNLETSASSTTMRVGGRIDLNDPNASFTPKISLVGATGAITASSGAFVYGVTGATATFTGRVITGTMTITNGNLTISNGDYLVPTNQCALRAASAPNAGMCISGTTNGFVVTDFTTGLPRASLSFLAGGINYFSDKTGINDTSPDAPLDIVSNVGPTEPIVSISSQNDVTSSIFSILGNGNVGIKTSAPASTFEIGSASTGTNTVNIFVGSAPVTNMASLNITGNSHVVRLAASRSVADVDTDIGFLVDKPGGIYELMRLDGGRGRVGVNDISPDATLDVVSNAAPTGSILSISSQTDATGGVFNVLGNGNVGISSATPIAQLVVAGVSNEIQLRSTNGNGVFRMFAENGSPQIIMSRSDTSAKFAAVQYQTAGTADWYAGYSPFDTGHSSYSIVEGSGFTRLSVIPGGIIVSTSQPNILTKRTYTQNTGSTIQTNVFFGSDTYKSNVAHLVASSSDTITIPTNGAGLYFVQCFVEFASGTGTYREVELYVNGAQIADTVQPLATAIRTGINNMQMMYLQAADAITCRATHDSVGNLAICATRACTLSAAKIW